MHCNINKACDMQRQTYLAKLQYKYGKLAMNAIRILIKYIYMKHFINNIDLIILK